MTHTPVSCLSQERSGFSVGKAKDRVCCFAAQSPYTEAHKGSRAQGQGAAHERTPLQELLRGPLGSWINLSSDPDERE